MTSLTHILLETHFFLFFFCFLFLSPDSHSFLLSFSISVSFSSIRAEKGGIGKRTRKGEGGGGITAIQKGKKGRRGGGVGS